MLLLLAACAGKTHPRTPGGDTRSTDPAPDVLLAVSSYFGGKVHLFDPDTGESVGVVAPVPGAQTVVAAPDGRWVAVAEGENRLVTVDPATFDVGETVVADGHLRNPDCAVFGPDGRLYVSSYGSDEVLRYEADGTFVDVFVPAGAGGLDGPDIGLAFRPDGELLVPGYDSNAVHRYDGATGAFLGDLVTAGDGLGAPRAIVVEADGRVLVASHDTGLVLAVDPGGAVTAFAELPRASGLVLDPARGRLLASTAVDDTVHALDPETGDDLGVVVDFRPIDGVTAVALLPSAR